MTDEAKVYRKARAYGNARVYEEAQVCGNATVNGCADICDNDCLLFVGGIGSRYGTTTFFTGLNGKIHVVCGRSSGTLDEFAAKVQETHGVNKYSKEYQLTIELSKTHIAL